MQHAVENLVARAFDYALLSLRANGIDNVEPLSPLIQEPLQFLGWVLQIGIHNGDDIAVAVKDAGRDRHLMPEVSRERQHLPARIAPVDYFQVPQTRVRRTI